MKRIISLMLVAMLLMGCLSIVAFADGDVRTGKIYVTVSGNEFSSFGGRITLDNGTITGISGVTGSTSGKVGYANVENKNVGSVTITVSVSVPANFCGTVNASFSQEEGKQVQFNEDGTVAGYINVSLSGSGSTTFDHNWANEVVTPGADCQTHGTVTKTCTICGAEDTTEGPVGAHQMSTEWDYDDNQHWHECVVCHAKADEAAHTLTYSSKAPVSEDEPGWEVAKCFCGYKKSKVIPWSPVPGMGDATPYGAYNAVFFIAAVFALCCTTGMIFKRKFIK